MRTVRLASCMGVDGDGRLAKSISLRRFSMRIFGRVVLAATAAFLVVTLAEGQQPGQPPFGGGGGGQNDALSLLRNASVKKELGVTDEQMEKVPAAVLNALGAVLDEK